MAIKTHWDGCWRAHLGCAVAEVRRLQAELDKLPERLRAHLDEVLPKCNGPGFLNRGMERACIQTFIAGWEASGTVRVQSTQEAT